MTALSPYPATSLTHRSASRPVRSSEIIRSEPLSGGIIALALVAGITTFATMVMAATTLVGLAWPDVVFRVLAVALVVAVMFAHSRKFSSINATFTLGVVLGGIPSLWIAAHHQIDHWDDFMTWLGNALYIWKLGGFPTATMPPVASVWPGYPPGSSIVLAAAWSVVGRTIETAGPLLNVACLAVLPGLVLRVVSKQPRDAMNSIAIGAVLGLAATLLNVGLDWHWVLSSLPETALLVVFAAAFVLASEMRLLNNRFSRSHLVTLAAILALITNLKQTGIVLVALLMMGTLVVNWTCPEGERHWFKRPILKLALVCAPCLAVWLSWQLYRVNIFPGHAFAFRPLNEWNFSALPDLLSAVGRSGIEHVLFFVPITVVGLRGWYVLARRWLAIDYALVSPADRLAALFALVESGYLIFLLMCYLGAFSEREARDAAEFFRYQSTLGAAGLIVALALVLERLPRALPVRTALPLLAVQLAIAAAILPAAGVYSGKAIYGPSEIAQLRQIGRKAGEEISRTGDQVRVQLPHNDGYLAVLIVRYDIWASAPLLVRSIQGDFADKELADRFMEVRRYAPYVLALENLNGVHCAILSHSKQLAILGTPAQFTKCQPLLTRLRRLDQQGMGPLS